MKELFILVGLAIAALIPLGAITFILVHGIEKANIKRCMKSGMTKEEAKKFIRQRQSSYKPSNIDSWEASRIKQYSNNLGVSQEAVVLFEQLTGRYLSDIESNQIKQTARNLGLSDIAVVIKQYGGR